MIFWCFAFVILILVKLCLNEEVDIIKSYNYPVETHQIETDDGYFLGVFRIPRGQHSKNNKPNAYPVLLVHGWMGTSYNWVVTGPKRALAFKLADNGYDVWLLNCRGTKHSRKHKIFDPDDKSGRFWKFTWHEIGIYDVPNSIDYILRTTNSKKLYYSGHSQANNAFLVMCSEKPEYNEKIKLVIGMAPPIFFDHMKEPITRSLALCCYKMIQKWLENQKIFEFPPFMNAEDLRKISRNFCGPGSVLPKTCFTFTEMFSIGLTDQLEPEIVPKLAEMGPGASSIYQPCHFAQCLKTGRFMQFDWGPRENIKRYGSAVPRDYNLSKVLVPVSLVYGETDWFTAEKDVIKLSKALPNLVDLHKIPRDKWSHSDFIWAKDAESFLNSYILKMLSKFLK